MDLLQLPEEILILIVKKLDSQSHIYLHQTCSYLSKIVTLYGVVKVCDVPPGPAASPSVLKLDFFKSVSGHLKVLNLCAVRNLTKSAILPAIKKLKCLETLNVSYTKIVIPDLVDIKTSCLSLKNISINFLFGKHVLGVKIPQDVLEQCQDVFKTFENVEFVGVMGNLMMSQLPMYILNKATLLNKVKFTVIKSNHSIYGNEICDNLFKFNYLELQMLPRSQVSCQSTPLVHSEILSMLDMMKIEYVIMQVGYDHDNKMMQVARWTSLKTIFFENFREPDCFNRLDGTDLDKNLIYLIWNKDTTVFNESFFSNLSIRIKCLLPQHILSSSISKSRPALKDIERVSICLDYKGTLPGQSNVKYTDHIAKKKRAGLANYTLGFDYYLKEINNLKLTLLFLYSPTVCLNSTSAYLKRLTYLNLTGKVNFSRDFFTVLFEICEKLETLNVELNSSVSCAKSISDSIFLSSSLKNFRLTEHIHLDSINVLLNSISNCKLIENIHIFNKNIVNTELKDLSFLVAKCPKLYSLYIRNMMSDNNRNKVSRLINDAKTKYGKMYLNFELNCIYMGDSYDPYIAVFNLNPIKNIF